MTHAKWAGTEPEDEEELQSLLLDIRQRVTELREHVEEQTKQLESDLDAWLDDGGSQRAYRKDEEN